MKHRAAELHAWLLLLPALVLLALFTHWPALETFIDSLHSTPRGRRAEAFVGIDNYRQMLEDPVFRRAIVNNLWYALGTIPTSIALALLMAIWVNDRIAGRTVLRMAYFTPTVLPMIAVANIWLFFYTPQYGLLEQVLGLFGAPARNWLGSTHPALARVTFVAIWKEAGSFLILHSRSLHQVPPALAETAAREGTSRCAVVRPV